MMRAAAAAAALLFDDDSLVVDDWRALRCDRHAPATRRGRRPAPSNFTHDGRQTTRPRVFQDPESTSRVSRSRRPSATPAARRHFGLSAAGVRRSGAAPARDGNSGGGPREADRPRGRDRAAAPARGKMTPSLAS